MIELPTADSGHEWIAPLAPADMGTVRFGLFSLDPATRQLLRDGQEVPLSPKAFQLLSLLVVNRSRAVSRQELHQALWPSTFVLETNLASLVAEIRRALDDDAAKPRFVRTMHRFGYRFVGKVDEPPMTAVRTPGAAKYLPGLGSAARSARRRFPLDREGSGRVGLDRRAGRLTASCAVPDRQRRSDARGSGKQERHLCGGGRVTMPRRLRDGDQIRLGSVVMTFQIPRVSVATETVS